MISKEDFLIILQAEFDEIDEILDTTVSSIGRKLETLKSQAEATEVTDLGELRSVLSQLESRAEAARSDIETLRNRI